MSNDAERGRPAHRAGTRKGRRRAASRASVMASTLVATAVFTNTAMFPEAQASVNDGGDGGQQQSGLLGLQPQQGFYGGAREKRGCSGSGGSAVAVGTRSDRGDTTYNNNSVQAGGPSVTNNNNNNGASTHRGGGSAAAPMGCGSIATAAVAKTRHPRTTRVVPDNSRPAPTSESGPGTSRRDRDAAPPSSSAPSPPAQVSGAEQPSSLDGQGLPAAGSATGVVAVLILGSALVVLGGRLRRVTR